MVSYHGRMDIYEITKTKDKDVLCLYIIYLTFQYPVYQNVDY